MQCLCLPSCGLAGGFGGATIEAYLSFDFTRNAALKLVFVGRLPNFGR